MTMHDSEKQRAIDNLDRACAAMAEDPERLEAFVRLGAEVLPLAERGAALLGMAADTSQALACAAGALASAGFRSAEILGSGPK